LFHRKRLFRSEIHPQVSGRSDPAEPFALSGVLLAVLIFILEIAHIDMQTGSLASAVLIASSVKVPR